MFIFIVAFGLFSFYFCMIPLKFAILFHSKPQPAISSGASIFEGRFALKRARRPQRHKKKALPPGILSPVLHAAKYLLPRISTEQISLSGIISLPDAAATALICGAGSSIHSACAPLGGRVCIDLIPDFSAAGCDVQFCGIFSVRMGHIIRTALIFAFEFLKNQIKERFAKWKTSIPLKTSCTPPWKASAT